MKEPSKVRESIGIVFQDPSSDSMLTGYENLKLHALMYDLPFSDIDKKINEVLGLVDLVDRKNDVVKKYSGGMRRRMEIARGLLHEPKILFLDEPTIGLDPQTRIHIWKYIQDLAKKMNMTVILTTHYMEEAEKLCDRIAIIDRGKIVALDSPDNLKYSLGGDIVTLKGKGLQLNKIKKLAFVKNVTKTNDEVVISIENAAENLQTLLETAGKVDCVDVHSPDLNDVFLNYTGRQIREQEGSELERIRELAGVNNK
jgi:ABC-2 type transport system ATP-binding protein